MKRYWVRLEDAEAAIKAAVYEAIGWAHAYCCLSLDNNCDPRTLEVPILIEAAERDLETIRARGKEPEHE